MTYVRIFLENGEGEQSLFGIFIFGRRTHSQTRWSAKDEAYQGTSHPFSRESGETSWVGCGVRVGIRGLMRFIPFLDDSLFWKGL